MIKNVLAALMDGEEIVYELIEVTYKNRVVLTQYYSETGKYKTADCADRYFYENGAFNKSL